MLVSVRPGEALKTLLAGIRREASEDAEERQIARLRVLLAEDPERTDAAESEIMRLTAAQELFEERSSVAGEETESAVEDAAGPADSGTAS